MPINVPNNLPAIKELRNENIFIMEESRASHQDIRPLRVAILNLMPVKKVAETDLIRNLSNTSLQVELDLLYMDEHESKNTPREHLEVFYKTFEEVSSRRYDGFIITGAPVELMPFEQVDYWKKLCEVMEWSKTNVTSTLHICWGAQAGLYYHYGIQKYPLPKKAFGVFDHFISDPKVPLVRGFDDIFPAPHRGIRKTGSTNCGITPTSMCSPGRKKSDPTSWFHRITGRSSSPVTWNTIPLH